MAISTQCQTPDAVYHTNVWQDRVSITVDLPHDLGITAKEAQTLETNMHNAMELVLAPYFTNSPRWCPSS